MSLRIGTHVSAQPNITAGRSGCADTRPHHLGTAQDSQECRQDHVLDLVLNDKSLARTSAAVAAPTVSIPLSLTWDSSSRSSAPYNVLLRRPVKASPCHSDVVAFFGRDFERASADPSAASSSTARASDIPPSAAQHAHAPTAHSRRPSAQPHCRTILPHGGGGRPARESAAPSQRVSTCLRTGSLDSRSYSRSYGNLLQLSGCTQMRTPSDRQSPGTACLRGACLPATLRSACCFDCCCHAGARLPTQHGASVRSMELPRP